MINFVANLKVVPAELSEYRVPSLPSLWGGVHRWTAAADVIMATQDVEVELQEVLIDTSAADPGPSGRTLVSVCVRVCVCVCMFVCS